MKTRAKAMIGIIFLVLLLSIELAITQPPTQRTVRGTVFRPAGSQVESGVMVRINNTNLSIIATTQTFGPSGNTGRYSAVLVASPGDIINVLAYNATNYGFSSGTMGQSQVVIDLILNRTRDSETIVKIIQPQNHTSYNSNATFNLTANVTVVGNDATLCNATLSFSVPGVFQLSSGETFTHNLGSISRGTTVATSWNLTGLISGTTNITVVAECASDNISIENQNTDTIINISGLDVSPPLINIFSPQNNTRLNNPVLFSYNVTDATGIQNCTLNINNVTVNATTNPQMNAALNFTYSLSQKYNSWQINCTDNSSSKNTGTSGLFNLTLNSIPSITALLADDPVALLGGNNKTVFCNGTASDGDSYSDITNINATLFFTGFSSESTDNASTHYTNSSCTTINSLNNNTDFRCSFSVEYYANNGTWFCNATAIDTINSTNSTQQSTTINDLLAIGISPEIIDFGSLEILQISPNDIIVNVTNYGNVPLDLQLYAYAITENDNLSMGCTAGTIGMEYERFSTAQSLFFDQMTSVNNTLNPVFVDFNLSKREGGGIEQSKSTFWKLQIQELTQGTCSGKVVFSAIVG